MKSTPPILLFAIITLFGCTKKEPIGAHEYIGFVYQQTKCNDAWVTGNTDSLKLNNVAKYLVSKNLYVSSLTIKQTGITETCSTCTCKTGKLIYVITLNSDNIKAAFTQLGFQQQ